MAEVAVGAAQSFIEGEFGGPTTESDSEITLAATATKVCDNDPERLSLTIINLGTNQCHIVFDNAPSTSRGIILVAGGGSVSMNVREDGTLPTREWWGVADSGTTNLAVIAMRRFALTGQA